MKQTATITISMRLDEEGKLDSLKPSMHLECGASLEELAQICRTEKGGCPFGGFGCPFARSDWKLLHEGERCSADPCRDITAEDWLEVFRLCDAERKERERKQWEGV